MTIQDKGQVSHVVPVAIRERGYDIHIGHGLLDHAASLIHPLLNRDAVVIVTDANVARTAHPARLEAALGGAGITSHLITVPAGETSKSIAELERLLEALLDLSPDRKTTLIALGGGVIGDLVGFAAAILLRGVDFIQIPTSLLAQVDSSVGGKTGINARHGKNLIGAFHQPRSVLIDIAVLDDLPVRELRSGYAELVKHAIIADAGLFAWLEAHAPSIFAGDRLVRAEAIARSIAIKAAVVARDERETADHRALLNFGHTFAHAYETLAGYDGSLTHGEAVAIGMMRATELSVRMGLCSEQDRGRVRSHLQSLGLATEIAQVTNRSWPADALLDAMRHDKKAVAGHLAFILSRGIGDAVVSRDVPDQLVLETLGS